MPISRRLALLLLSASSLPLLQACAGDRRGPQRGGVSPQQLQLEQRMAALHAGAYQRDEPGPLSLALQQWIVRGELVPVSLAFAGSGRQLPLIVYMPGLGESAQAGARWRQAWARAGYAVLSVQPLDVDARAWSSDLARAADFKGLARHHLQPELQQQRLLVLDAVLTEARRRAAAGDSLWTRVDFEQIALAGYELGALTAWMADAAPVATPRIRARLIVSPLPPAAPGSVQQQAAPTIPSGPLLAIGSRRDIDPSGLFEGTPQQRMQLFEQLPADGRHYLMMLTSASHAQLAGPPGLDHDDAADGGMMMGGGGRQRRGGGGGGMGGGMGGGAIFGPRGGADIQLQALAIENASVAFFDAHLRAQPRARDWLEQEAGSWLQGLADWRQR
ncbi:hypothetical protein [Roseateles violae]|uniref:Alpha/beta hydrolase n=1 Tax=Roseateles violae TaxID=3058042 RepID=A0ABT8DRE3_9BURK|nr:hypothetical protein [Pelomonas sp. PFR6]MDN3918691.1 hypothetical protein [Pelomonas sp. PFR6]